MRTLAPTRARIVSEDLIARNVGEGCGHRSPKLRALVWALRFTVLLTCAFQAVATRHQMNPDGLSYLDIASAYQAGEWSSAINTYWSPLYSWLLAAALAVFRPAALWESTVAHGVNFGLAVLALVAFEFALSELLRRRDAEREKLREEWFDLLPDWLVVGVAYTLFAAVLGRLVTVASVTPDLLVVAGTLAASALLMRARRTESPTAAAALGVVLGLSYLAKAVMFPLAVVYLGLALVRLPRRAFLTALASFVLVAGPWVATLSLHSGRLTLGDSGRLNYLWFVNGVAHPNRLAGLDRPMTPAAPKALSRSPLLTLSHPKSGETCPLWYDPARYYESVAPRFDLGRQFVATARVAAYYNTMFSERLMGWTTAIGMLLLCGFFGRRGGAVPWLRDWAWACLGHAPLLLPAFAGLGLYLAVGHGEGRLAGPFALLLGVGLLTTVRLPHPRQVALRPVGGALVAVLGLSVAMTLAHDAAAALRPEANAHYNVAEELRALSVEPGDEVASIGMSYSPYWARLGGYAVPAEMSRAESARFWAATPADQARVLTACRLAGARAAVCEAPPPGVLGWRAVPGTTYAVRRLDDDGAEDRLDRRQRREP